FTLFSMQAPTPAPSPSPLPARDPSLPAAEDTARAALDAWPRHGEDVDVKVDVGRPPMRAWIVHPERKEKAGVVVVIHEIFGLSDWIRAAADRPARDGFIAIAPAFVSGHGPGGGGTDSVASRDDVVKLVREATPEETVSRLNAVRDFAMKLPSANGKVATIGFCWGGGRSFAYAAAQPALNAAVVYYGTSPETPALGAVRAPVLGLYGGDVPRVNAPIGPAEAEVTKLGKTYEPKVYEVSGTGFM